MKKIFLEELVYYLPHIPQKRRHWLILFIYMISPKIVKKKEVLSALIICKGYSKIAKYSIYQEAAAFPFRIEGQNECAT